MQRLRSIKSLFALQAAVLVLLVLATNSGIIQFHYPRGVDNNPLHSPVRVSSVVGSTLTLEDGRSYLVEPASNNQPLEAIVEESDSFVDIELSDDGSHVVIFAKRRNGIFCGTPWVGLIEIPLIADDVPLNDRDPIGRAVNVRRQRQ